ncbi:MAG TPA: right-handed parallel beta-helix repeat-containing protein [Gemmatimonadaceae bacterium]|nr:right-handed parallel beta-helix repeat-containing protein [Gemmatimonadaceae bacterium]
MRNAALASAGLLLFASIAGAQGAVPRVGLVVTSSTAFAAGAYSLAPSPGDSAVIVIRGNDVTVDLRGVRLMGTSPNAAAVAPDAASGVAILVDGGRNITILGGTIRGYKIGIRARGTRNLRVIDTDLSFNWKPRLYSIVEHESIADWLSFHQNEKDEWRRFGAGVYLDDVRGGEIRGVTVQQGMNGLLMTRTDSLLVWNSDFSFNSGVGIGMYRSDHNRIMHNTVDYNVRGYSEGFYRRGQDSAGILMYEQSDSNVVAFNSVTHGGDGLFLWAGQHTMDTGKGGANDNLFFGNDFSWAPTNGMEATFSRNAFVANRIVGSDHGLWGGYSYGSVILGNEFARNRVGIAIEHGQENRILHNDFLGDSTALYLWANTIEPGDWGYPKYRDTRSRDYHIEGNAIDAQRVAFRVSQTRNLDARRNQVRAESLFVTRGDTAGVVLPAMASSVASLRRSDAARKAMATFQVRHRPEGAQVLPSTYADWPRSTIIVDEWGPYDWKSPKLWPVDSSRSTPLKLRVLGPPGHGTWEIWSNTGADVSKRRGLVNDTITVTPALLTNGVEDWEVQLEYRGQATRSPTGDTLAAGVPYRFGYARFDPRMRWDVKVFAWTDSTHPLNAPASFQALLRGERGAPVLTQQVSPLDYMWYRPRIPGWPQDKYGIAAATTVDLPSGSYRLRTISDDGIRVFVDDQLVIEDWSVHESRVKEVPLSGGRHAIRVEYFQGDGWAELRVEILR